MLELKNIKKTYAVGGEEVHALRGVDIQFRESEFVAILGHSGCGKTTMLNIIGGLDQYTEGDLVINGRSTKDYSDRDWDTYRNHSVGFVFQSYHLIPHQTVLQNVELALTLSGVGKAERRKRAAEALQRVGLGDQLRKRPSEMSGGQMQRVAIARAIVNNPDIILADEPTGALDSETSVQVMDILKEIAQDRLVIMVTHNPELAKQYATRTIRVLDGRVIGDSMPLSADEVATLCRQDAEKLAATGRQKRPAMSFFTSFGLSLRNLMTKKGRTTLTAFAGSIGIIGIALIFAVSQGTNNYIDSIQEDTLSSYPLTITAETADMSSMLTGFASASEKSEESEANGTVSETQVVSQIFAQVGTNDLKSFKAHMDKNMDNIKGDLNALQYSYGVEPQIYTVDCNGDILCANPSDLFNTLMAGYTSTMMTGTGVFTQMLDNRELLDSQYDVLVGHWPEKYNELLLVLPDADSMLDYTSYAVGLRDQQELKDMISQLMDGKEVEAPSNALHWTYDELLDLPFRLINASDYYRYNSNYKVWEDMRDDDDYMQALYDGGEPLHVVGIVTAKKGVAASAITVGFAYLPSLTEHVITQAADAEIVKQQLADRDVDIFSGRTFEDLEEDNGSMLDFADMISVDEDALSDAFGGDMDEDKIKSLSESTMKTMQGSITADTTAARNYLDDTTNKLATGLLNSALTSNGGIPMLNMASASDITAAYLATAEAKALMSGITSHYLIPTDVLSQQFYAGILPGLIPTYMQAYASATDLAMTMIPPVPPTPTDLVAPTVTKYLSMAPIDGAAAKMAQGMTEAVMQKNILTAFGNYVTDFTESLSDAFNVDEDAIAGAFDFNLDEDELTRLMSVAMGKTSAANANGNLQSLGYADLDEPTGIFLYLKDFDAKEHFLDFIDRYNDKMESLGMDEQIITYTDITGVLMSSVTTIINAVTYVLIAFVAISLIVSSIMIGVITLISVQERTREIGILRAIGASKRNVSSMFNAETVIIGFISGALGVTITYLLCIPINIILHKVTGIATLSAALPVPVAIVLVLISVSLTLFAGIIPSRSAAKKDPVVALRTE